MGVRAGALHATGVTAHAGGAAGTGAAAGAAAGVVIVTVEGEEKNGGGS